MFCSGCGNNISAHARFCKVCGKEVPAGSAGAPAASPPAAIGPPQTSGKAIASLACGVFLFAFPLSIVAIVLGHLSLSEIRKNAGRLKGEGIGIAGLVLGYIGLAAIPVILIIAAIAIPNLLRARMAANESSAVRGVQVLVMAEVAYSSSHPNTGYTCSLSDLASAGLVDARLASGQKSGYIFELLGCRPANEGPANNEYRVVAYPAVRQQTGTRAFCSDESGVLKFDRTASPQDCMANGSTLK